MFEKVDNHWKLIVWIIIRTLAKYYSKIDWDFNEFQIKIFLNVFENPITSENAQRVLIMSLNYKSNIKCLMTIEMWFEYQKSTNQWQLLFRIWCVLLRDFIASETESNYPKLLGSEFTRFGSPHFKCWCFDISFVI